MMITTILVKHKRLGFCPENWPNAESFHMRLFKNEHDDISFLFHTLTVHT